jgi:DNA-binding MarR family transcriptional regulator
LQTQCLADPRKRLKNQPGPDTSRTTKQVKEKQDRYIRLHHYLLKTSAWLGLSTAARAAYVQLAFRYNGSNNGRIAYSVRDAAAECRLKKDTASRAFKELVDGGFIEATRNGGLSRKTRLASEWRLTEYRCDLTGAVSTKPFMTRGALANANHQPQASRAKAARLSEKRGQPVRNEGTVNSRVSENRGQSARF